MFDKLKQNKEKKAEAKQEEEIKEVEDKLHKERLDRCIPIAREILTALATQGPFIGDVVDPKTGDPKPEAHAAYNKIALDVLGKMHEANLMFVDKLFLFQLVTQAVELLKEKVQTSIENSLSNAEKKLWGKDSLDISLDDIDCVLGDRYDSPYKKKALVEKAKEESDD